MGKGKGTFEFWATRLVQSFHFTGPCSPEHHSVPTGRVIFEIGGIPIREELARESAYLCPRPLALKWTYLGCSSAASIVQAPNENGVHQSF